MQINTLPPPRKINNREVTWLSKSRAFSLDFAFRVSVNTGMKAELKVPSPNILRNKLGKVKASMNASPSNDAPKQPKKRISRPRPRNRESRVRELTRDSLPINLTTQKKGQKAIRNGCTPLKVEKLLRRDHRDFALLPRKVPAPNSPWLCLFCQILSRLSPKRGQPSSNLV